MTRSKDAVVVREQTCADCGAKILVKLLERKQRDETLCVLCPGCLEARVQAIRDRPRGYGPRR